MKKKYFSLILAIVFIVSSFSAFASPVNADVTDPPPSVRIAGVDLLPGGVNEDYGVSFSAPEGETPTLTLSNSHIPYVEGEPGIQISGFDNFRIVVSGENTIDAGQYSTGIRMEGGNLTIGGDGTLTITGDRGIWMDGLGIARTLAFEGSVTADISKIEVVAAEDNQTRVAFRNTVSVRLHQSRQDFGNRIDIDDTATLRFAADQGQVLIGSQNLVNPEETIDGFTFTEETYDTPATLTLNGASIQSDEDGEQGIQISGFDNFGIVVSGENTINVGGPGSVGILMRGGNLTIGGTGSIDITGESGIWMDGFTDARTLTFIGSLTADINYLRLEPNSEGNQTVAFFNDSVNVTLNQSAESLAGRFTKATTAQVTFDSQGGGPGPSQSVIIAGQDVANEGNVQGVTFTPAEGEIPATLTLNGLICAGTAYGEGEGAGVAGIRIYGFDNFRIVVSGTNSIDASTGHGSVGILMRSGTLTIEGDGTLNVTGESGIWMDCMPTARTLTFNGVVTADISRLRLEPNSEGNQTTAAFNDNVNVTLHQSESDLTGRFTKAGTATVTFAPGGGDPPGGDGYDPSQPSVFRFGADECTADPDDFEGITSEQIVGSGTGWEVNALPPDPADPVSSVGFGVTLIDYNAGPIYIDNWDGFLSMDGDINIGANLDGYSFECHNSNIQFWGLPGPDSEIGAVSMAGGILIDNTEFGSMVYDQWQIGTADQKSPVGITGMNYAELVLNGDIFTIYTEGDAVSGMTEVWVRDEAQFVAYADGEGIDQVGSLYALTGSSFEIHYGLGESVEPVLDETVNHMIMYLEPKPEQLDEVFPEPIKYYGDANTNTLIYWVDERPEYFQEAVSIPELQRKYVLTDEEMDTGRRYYFESTASRMTRVHADDDGSMEGGTILVRAANGYNDGGYVVEAGSTVRVEILPDAGYQYKSGTLLAGNDAPIALTATADPAIYTYIMPDSTMAVGCEFELKSDQVVANSESIDSATAIIPAGTIQNGNALFKVEDSEMTDEELATSLNGIEDIEVGAALDLTLNQMITKDGSAVDPWLTPITELDNAMTVSLTVDEEIQGMTGYRVFRIHEGVTEEIDATYLNGVVSFDTDRFSTYILGWDEVPTYTITYNVNGGSGLAPTPVTLPEGDEMEIASGSGLSRTGFTFSGWNTASDGSGTSYAVNSTFTFDADTTLYAQWTVNNYTITFNSAGGSAVAAMTAAFGSSLTAPTDPTRDGYTFAGWTPAFPETMPLNGDTLTAQWTPIPTPSATVSYRTHVQDIGWQSYVSDGAVAGTSAQSKRLEAIQIKLEGISGGIEYSTHIQDIGWQGFVANDAMSGTSGRSKRLEAIMIRLTGAAAEVYDVYYCVHAQDIGWLDWAKNGEASGTAGFGYRLEAIKIVLVPKDGPAPGATERPFIQAGTVRYRTHVQDIGWQPYVSNGEVAGTSAQSKRLEAIQIKLEGISGGIEYSTHIQDIGWQGFVANDAMSGTSGRSKRLEAIKIRLTGAAAEVYDVYYCVHAQDTGWLDWAKNGEASGTAGFSYRLEAIKIVLVPKGAPAPGPTTRTFLQG